MNKYKVTIQPMPPASEEVFLVGGFDENDAQKQGVFRWKMENEDRYLNDILDVLVEPYTEGIPRPPVIPALPTDNYVFTQRTQK